VMQMTFVGCVFFLLFEGEKNNNERIRPDHKFRFSSLLSSSPRNFWRVQIFFKNDGSTTQNSSIKDIHIYEYTLKIENNKVQACINSNLINL